MLLIIPAIRIRAGKCIFRAKYEDGTICSDDPVEMAKLWRCENAKSLHVTDFDAIDAGRFVNLDVIKKMIETVDIPIELGGGIQSLADAQRAFDIGVYRILIGTLFLEKPTEAVKILQRFGGSKVVIGLSVENNNVVTKGWVKNWNITLVESAQHAKFLGFNRIVYRNIFTDGKTASPNFEAIKDFAIETGMRVTASGGIRGLSDLLRMQELVKHGVDSVVIGKALYENKFSCQGIWRVCESMKYPFTAKV